MIRMQIVEQPGRDLFRELQGAMRSGALQTFFLEKRGRKVRHVSDDYPGWMNWKKSEGIITCEILSPKKPGSEWRLFHAFLGRLASRFPHLVHSISIQFPDAVEERGASRKTRKRMRKSQR